jgi:hypothetical protein
MKKLIVLFSFLELINIYSFSQQPLPDSLSTLINKAKNATEKIDAFINAGDFYYQYFDALGYSRAANYYEKLYH